MNGKIEQWGFESYNAMESKRATKTMPLSFSNSTSFCVQITPYTASGVTAMVSYNITNEKSFSYGVFCGNGGKSTGVSWIAIDN